MGDFAAILILTCKIEILIWADTGAAGNAPTKSKTHNHSGFQLIYVEVSRRPPVVALKLFKMRIAGDFVLPAEVKNVVCPFYYTGEYGIRYF